MKTENKIIAARVIQAVWALAAIALIGCAAMDKALVKPVVTTVPQQVTSTNVTLVTNLYTVPASTNVEGKVIPEWQTAVVTPTMTYTYAPAHSVTNWVVRPEVEAGIGIAKALPVPYVGLAAIAAGWFATFWANLKNKKGLKSVVEGVEAVRVGLQTTPEGQALDSKIKQILVQHQELAGTLKTVSNVVNDITGNTTRDPEDLGEFVSGVTDELPPRTVFVTQEPPKTAPPAA